MIVFYPKNVFLDDKQFELFLFCTNRCMVNVKIDDDEQYFIIRYIKIDDIYKIELKESVKDKDEKILNINLKNGESIEFNSKNDTNQYHKVIFASLIDEIIKYIIEFPDK